MSNPRDAIDTRGTPSQRDGLRRAAERFAEAKKAADACATDICQAARTHDVAYGWDARCTERLAIALDEFAGRARQAALESVNRALELTLTEECDCGGSGPGESDCVACKVYHALRALAQGEGARDGRA